MFSSHLVAPTRANLRLAALLIAAVLLAACGSSKGGSAATGSSGVAATAAAGSVAGNVLLLTRDQSLLLRDLRTAKETRLFTAPAGQFPTYPVWSPDGKRFAYMLDTPLTGSPTADWGSDMYVADPNGANARLVLKHDQPGAELESPTWTPDGNTIVYSYFLTQYDAQGQYKGQVYEARKLNLTTGENVSFAKDANGTDLCRDGSKLTYVNFNQETDFTSFGIWTADADGQNGRAIVGSDSNLQAFYAPHFSPDCKRVIFAAVGTTLGEQRSPTGSSLLTRIRDLFRPAAAEAHGPPWDLWIVNADGTGLKRISHLNEDLPYPAWSADGQSVMFIGTGGLYQMSPDGSNIKKVADGTVHGQISWRQR